MSCAQPIDILATGGAHVPAFGNGFTSVIPFLGEHFQPRLQPPASKQVTELALSLLTLRPDIPLTGKEGAVDVLEAALRQCGEESGYAEDFNLGLRLISVEEHYFDELGYIQNEQEVGFVEVSLGTLGGINLLPVLCDLYADSPEMATQFLAFLDVASRNGAWIVTPYELLGMASSAYWYGEEDETLFLEEVTDDPNEREDIRANMVTRADFDAIYPEWMLTVHVLRPVPEIAELVSRLPPHWQALGSELLALVEQMASLRPELPNNLHMQATGGCVAFHAILSTGDEHVGFVERILDDHYQYAMEIAGFDVDALIPVVRAEDMAECLDKLLLFLKFQCRLDRFLKRLVPD